MDREEIERSDFPAAPDGYDRASVDAHLTAVAALVEALKARVDALGVELDATRRGSAPTSSEIEEEVTGAGEDGEDPRTDRSGLPDDPVSARLLASKLHLDGVGRDEVIARVSAGYRVEDPAGLVDEVIEGLA